MECWLRIGAWVQKEGLMECWLRVGVWFEKGDLMECRFLVGVWSEKRFLICCSLRVGVWFEKKFLICPRLLLGASLERVAACLQWEEVAVGRNMMDTLSVSVSAVVMEVEGGARSLETLLLTVSTVL